MGKNQTVGFDDLDDMLRQLGDDADAVCKMAVYEGAKAVADQVKRGIESIPVYDPKDRDAKRMGATEVEKEGLIAGMGVAGMKRNGDGWDTVIGFDGYNSDVTKAYPKGKANSMVARSINSGTYWLTKFPFITRAYNRAKSPAEAAMAAKIDQEIQKRLK